jgi:hypothetical protein
MTALTDHAAEFHRDKNLEPRELRVGVEEQDEHSGPGNGEGAPIKLVHDVAPVELASAPDCAAGSGAPTGEAIVVGGQAFVGIVVIRRPLKLRIWRW